MSKQTGTNENSSHFFGCLKKKVLTFSVVVLNLFLSEHLNKIFFFSLRPLPFTFSSFLSFSYTALTFKFKMNLKKEKYESGNELI